MPSKHFNPLDACEIKMSGDRTFEGYASVWGSVDSYGDTVAKGAFTKTLKEGRRPMMFFGHSPGRVLGKWLSLEEDDKGLKVRGEFTPGHRDAEDVYASLKHGAIDGLSIGFRDRDSEQLEGGGRLLKEIELLEISVVSMPAEQLATITSVKSYMDSIETLRGLDAYLREAWGASRTEAAYFISRFKQLCQRESEAEREAEMKRTERIERNTKALIRLIQTNGGDSNE